MVYNYLKDLFYPNSFVCKNPYREEQVFFSVGNSFTMIVTKEDSRMGNVYRIQYEAYPDFLPKVECYDASNIFDKIEELLKEYVYV